MSSDNTAHRQLQKRRKTQLACSQCRSRKTRCDGNRPSCLSCKTRGLEKDCLYEKGSLTPNRSLTEIESRLRRLENGHSFNASLNDHQNEGCSVENTPFSSNLPPIAGNNNRNGYTARSRIETADSPTTFSASNHDDTGIFGSSSNFRFLEHIRDALTSKDANIERADSPGSLDSEEGTNLLEPIDFAEAGWTDKQLSDELMTCFWNHIHPIFPILHRPTAKKAYEKYWNARDASHSSSMSDINRKIQDATISIMFALGCQYFEGLTPQQRSDHANELYERAQKLIPIDTIDVASLSIVQLLLLTCIYLQSTKYANRCWNVIGVALRVAQGLGLHLDQERTSETQVKREMRLRVWYNCVMLDKLAATTFGRPTLLTDEWSVRLPQKVEDEDLSDSFNDGFSSSPLTQMHCFVNSIELFEILGDALQTLYGPYEITSAKGSYHVKDRTSQSERTSPSKLSQILDLNSRLDACITNLPDILRSQTTFGPRSFTNQARVFRCRCLYVRILILRPCLFVMERNDSEVKYRSQLSGLEQKVLSEISRLCISTAISIIDILHEHIQGPLRSPSWHAVYFTFAAASVLITATVSPNLDSDMGFPKTDDWWEKACNIFNYNKMQSESVSRGLKVLKKLHQKVSTLKAQGLSYRHGRLYHARNAQSTEIPAHLSDFLAFETPNETGLTDMNAFEDAWFMSQAFNTI